MAVSELKSSLKVAKQMLVEQKYQEASDILQPLIDKGIEDYQLFCFGALALANSGESESAQALYLKALKLDRSKPIAWQGLYKVYTSDEDLLDEMALEVFDWILKNNPDDEKLRSAIILRRSCLFILSRYDDLLSDFGENVDFAKRVEEKLSKKAVRSSTEKALLIKAYEVLKTIFSCNADINLRYVQALYTENSLLWLDEFNTFVTNHGCSEKWVAQKYVELSCADYFVDSSLPFIVDVQLAEDSLKLLDFSDDINEMIRALLKGDTTGAIEVMEGMNQINISGDSPIFGFMAARLLIELESWGKAEKVLVQLRKLIAKSKQLDVNYCVSSTLEWLLVRCEFEGGSNNVKLPLTTPLPEFLLDVVKIDRNSDYLKNLEEFDQKRTTLQRLVIDKQFERCEEYLDYIISHEKSSFRELLLVAEAKMGLGEDPTAVLVKTAKMNPRSTRAFFLLGKALAKKNPPKARGCLERAVKFWPTNSEYVKELDEVLKNANVDPASRLLYLKNLANGLRFLPIWLRKLIASLSIETGDIDVAITHLQHIVRADPIDIHSWANLANSYAKRGHLQSSVKAFEEVLKLDGRSDYAVSMMNVLVRLRKDEEALHHYEQWKSEGGGSEFATQAAKILETQILMRLAQSAHGAERREFIRKALKSISEVLQYNMSISLVYKLAADLLILISNYRLEFYKSFEIPLEWKCNSRGEIIDVVCSFYANAVNINKDNVCGWSDLSTALLLRARFHSNKDCAQKAIQCLKRTISCCSSTSVRSDLWTKLAEAMRIIEEKPEVQQHCLIRALMLNKNNDQAWLRLALLYMTNNEPELAHQAFEAALKSNPQSAEAWCGWAAKAEASGHLEDASAMFVQALTIKPVKMALCKYVGMVCEELQTSKKNSVFDSSTVFVNFESLLEISNDDDISSPILENLGILAELFGYYEEAVNCHQLASTSNEVNLIRAQLKSGRKPPVIPASLEALRRLVDSSTKKLFELLQTHNFIYSELFKLLRGDDEEASGLRQLFLNHRKSISIPLLVSAVIYFKLDISDAAVAVIHDQLPRHELVDVFPTVMPEGMDNELKYLEQDGEQPFRYVHHVAKELVEELKLKRESLNLGSSSPLAETEAI